MKARHPVLVGPLALALAVSLLAGCGGAPAPRPARQPARQHAAGSRDPAKKGSGSDTAAVARNATLKRRGSWKLTSDQVQAVAPLVREAARANGITEDLIFGIIWVESRFNPEAVSPVGARGLMQLMPRTADYLADCIDWRGRHDSFDPAFNVAAGSYYIARLIKQFDGDEDLALAAYNAGPTKIRRWMSGSGLPKVSIEYHTMVQTARGFFGAGRATGSGAPPAAQVPTDAELDRLGLAILIAGLSDREFGLERTDDATPFD